MYKPLDNGHCHAVREATFTVFFRFTLTPDVTRKIVQYGREHWPELPRVEDIPAGMPVGLPVDAAAGPAFALMSSASFMSFKPDGSVRWRVQAAQNSIMVNCLDYTGWDDVAGRAFAYLNQCLAQMNDRQYQPMAAQIQYLNGFNWQGEIEQADAGTILRRNCPLIPEAFWGHMPSAEWHLNQGYFSETPIEEPGRILHHQNVFAQIEASPTNRVAALGIDLTHRFDLRRFRSGQGALEPGGYLIPVFDTLRRIARADLRLYLKDEILASIRAEALE